MQKPILFKPVRTTSPAASHVRLKPLSVNDRRALRPTATRVRPLSHIVQKPKTVLPRQIRAAPAKAFNRHQPQPQTRATTAKPERYKNIGVGRTLVIIGNGPSHKMAPLDRLKGLDLDIMSINKPDDRLWPTTYWLFCDNTQLIRHRVLWEQYGGPIFNTPSIRDEKTNTVRLKSLSGPGFSYDLNKGVHIGLSSVYAALQVAKWMNYDNIYLFGCDMNLVGGKLYPWGSNPDVSDAVRAKRFAGEAKSYQWAADHLDEPDRKRFIFCSEFNNWPFQDKFQKLTFKDGIDRLVRIFNPLQT